MSPTADPSPLASIKRKTSVSAWESYASALRNRPLGASFGLVIEYLMFASAVFLALSLYLTRVPMRAIDRAFGLRLRERFLELLARVSPG
jgi:hypothetical protein